MSPNERTVTFIDLAGYTTATSAHGDQVAADLAEKLVALANASLGQTDQLVKGLGDGVMLTSRTPADAVALAGRVCHRADHEPAFPLLRIGLHHGPVVERNDDWYGATVNIAARVAALAEPDQVVGTSPIAEAATRRGMEVVELGATVLRGVKLPVDLFAVTPCPPVEGRAVDPICRMAVMPPAAANRTHGTHRHYFCSPECARAFDDDSASQP